LPRPPLPVPLALAAAVAAASLTPSLVPKPVLVQGVVTGVAAVIGYAFGVLLWWVTVPLWRRLPPQVRRWGGLAVLAVATSGLVGAAWYSYGWQRDLAASLGLVDPPPYDPLTVLGSAVALMALLMLLGRGLRLLIRWTSRWLARRLPEWVAAVLATVLVLVVVGNVAWYVVEDRILATVDESFRVLNQQVHPDLAAPTDQLRSGSPGSAVAWETIGRQGQEFLALPEPTALETVRPVRVYAGIESAAEVQERAELVVQELVRTGGFDRAVLCLVVPTGTGWVDPDAVIALEELWGGDTAVASLQYSYLPSWLSFLVDRQRVEQAGVALLEAVLQHWRTLPPQQRPRLLLYGESLGSRGAEVALREVPGAEAAVEGVLLVGPPNSNPVWSGLVAQRDPGSPVLAPELDGGRMVRFWPGPEIPGLMRAERHWPNPRGRPRVLYLQHPSDPVVWWSPDLIWSEPEWVDEREQLTTMPSLQWRPVVTFVQVTGDLLFATEVPGGHGHNYAGELTRAWSVVAPPGQ
jgi:uncharacterized membrane protein